ncbi:hypothetical protein M3Y94_00832900 [Aphelenchoides besseyi]|nr:hypothetical protein M3Y94_00832900 [Aphelenchoides besseyi]KAI6227000.1 G-PROTEIN-RECEP-F1-2 domain-containing protein [Aphelenchoides besseyi]
MTSENDTLLSNGLLIKTPEIPWCFDLILYYKSNEDDDQARTILEQLETYSKFSFYINGVVTCLLASFGLLGNLMFVYQIHKSRYFSRRLAFHLSALCVWDMALLLCCLLTYGIVSLHYGIIPIVGIVAYLLYFFQPFASLCVTASIWQVVVISLERYTAVSKPLEQRTRNAQFSVRAICSGIALGAFLLNMASLPFERQLTPCYEFTQEGFVDNTMIAQEDIVNNQYYAILVHLIPDIIFRAPTPIVLIAILTVRTLTICSRRTVGGQIIQSRRSVHYMLTILNIKFIMCNTLYVFNTILVEVIGFGGKTSSQQTELEMEQYIRSLYLTDFSNLLLAFHSATNWLIFYHWPKLGSSKKYSTLTITSSSSNSKSTAIDRNAAELLLSKFSAQKYKISSDILLALCKDSPTMSSQLMGRELTTSNTVESANSTTTTAASRAAQIERQQQQQAQLHKHAVELATVIEEVLFALTSKGFSIVEWRELCRQIGYKHQYVGNYCGAEQWKMVRDILVASMNQTGSKWYGSKVHQIGAQNLQKTMMKVFNYALREMKSGALCAMVDASHQQIRAFKTPEMNNNNPVNRVGTMAAASTINFASSAIGTKRTPRKDVGSWRPHRESLKAVDSFGNCSLDSATLESPTVHSRSRTILSRFSFLTTSSCSNGEAMLEKNVY